MFRVALEFLFSMFHEMF